MTDRPLSHIPPAGAVGEGGAPYEEAGPVGEQQPGPGNGGAVNEAPAVTPGPGNGSPSEPADDPWASRPDLGQEPDQGYESPEDSAYDGAYDDVVEDHGYAAYEDGDEDVSYDGPYEQSFEEPEEQAYGGPQRRHSGNSLTRRRRRRRFVAALGVVVTVLVVVGIVGFIRVSHDIHPTGHPGRAVSVSIPNGASTAKIGDELAKAGVIHGPLVFELYVKLEGAGPLMPGTYRLGHEPALFQRGVLARKGPAACYRQARGAGGLYHPPDCRRGGPPSGDRHLVPGLHGGGYQWPGPFALRASEHQQPGGFPVPRHLPGPERGNGRRPGPVHGGHLRPLRLSARPDRKKRHCCTTARTRSSKWRRSSSGKRSSNLTEA